MTADQPRIDGGTLIAVDSHETAMLTCPYHQRLAGARCVSGCWEEPVCMADEPREGWQARDRDGQPVEVTAEQVLATAQTRLDEYHCHHPTSFPLTTTEPQ